MALPTFLPPVEPSVGAASEPKIELWQTEFGDGYTSRSPKGLNHIRDVLELKFELLTAPQAATMLAFLEERGGWQAFMFALTGEPPRRYICAKWKRQFEEAGYRTITATFEQDFGIAT